MRSGRFKSRTQSATIVSMAEDRKHAESRSDGNGALVRSIETRDSHEVALLIEQLGYRRSHDEVAAWINGISASSTTQAAFVACLGDEVVGWIEVSIQSHLQSAPFALIGGLVVKDGLRGKGIGKKLCETAEVWACRRSVSVLRVTSRSTRADAHHFYENIGYEPTKISHVFEKSLLMQQPCCSPNSTALQTPKGLE